MSDSVRPHRRQPTRRPRSWDSPGKNTGVGCHFLLHCRKVKSESEVAQSCPTLSDPKVCSPLVSSVHGIFQARVLEWGAIAFSRLAFKAKCSSVSSSWCKTPRLRSPMRGSDRSLLEETSAIVVILLFEGHPPGDLDFAVTPPLLAILLWFLLYILSCRGPFLLDLRSFSSTMPCK